ncbi:uncharacterized protein RAG0_09014 [Rhynchosporium agropyri]|uniref:Uncharacterized protein n=1 Tax=Rhynchosporium agropyri TaxID=914238 RepID=A0A1E1KTG7_9HELO|nr:uncharacterized protein RAG0_09014 [Rhynchosporium agropyri]
MQVPLGLRLIKVVVSIIAPLRRSTLNADRKLTNPAYLVLDNQIDLTKYNNRPSATRKKAD